MNATDVLSPTPEQCSHQREQQSWSHSLPEGVKPLRTPLGVLGDLEEGPWRSATETSSRCVYRGASLLFFLETRPELGGEEKREAEEGLTPAQGFPSDS